MTDLTPEQIEKWAGDEDAQAAYAHQLRLARDPNTLYPGGGMSAATRITLHAHAKILQQQATIERLTALIDEHNRRCSQHPLDRAYMIDTQDGVK